MGETTSVDTDLMAKLLPQITAARQFVESVHNGLVAGQEALADAAGNDAAGRQFTDAHTQARDQWVQSASGLVGTMVGIEDGVNTSVHGYTQTEDDNVVRTLDAKQPDGNPTSGAPQDNTSTSSSPVAQQPRTDHKPHVETVHTGPKHHAAAAHTDHKHKDPAEVGADTSSDTHIRPQTSGKAPRRA